MIREPPEYQGLLYAQEWLFDPHPTFKMFRGCWPVARVDWPRRGAGEWLVTRYADIRFVLNSPDFSINRGLADFGPEQPQGWLSSYYVKQEPLANTVLLIDPPEHSCFRRPLISQVADQMSRVQPRLESILDPLLKKLVGRHSFDLIGDFAAPFSATVMAELMGFGPDSLEHLQKWSSTYVQRGFAFGPGFVSRSVWGAVAHLKDFLGAGVSERRRNPREDLISAMISTSPDWSQLTEQRIVNTSLLILTAGMQTMKHAIGNSILALIEHPDALSDLVIHQNLIPMAVEECLRYDGPSQAVGRVAKVDIELSGVCLSKGAFLRLALASANRDPQQFDHADTVDVWRQTNRHLAFGSGSHTCPGAQLARLATRVALQGLLKRYRGFSLVPGGGVRELYSSLRGFRQLQVVGHRH